MFRTIGDQPSLWESVLPPEVLRLPGELARVDALLDDPAFWITASQGCPANSAAQLPADVESAVFELRRLTRSGGLSVWCSRWTAAAKAP